MFHRSPRPGREIRRPARPRQLLAPEARPQTVARPETRQGIKRALWLGGVTGLLELTMVVAQRSLAARISMASLRTNEHFVWMIPLADVVLFGTVGLVLGRLLRSRPALALRVSASVLTGLLALALLLRIEGLYAIARGVLALGFAATAFRRYPDMAGPLDRLVRTTLPVLGGGEIVLFATSVAWLATAETRAHSRLPAAAPGAPNVLLLVLDNVRAASMSLHGYGRATTPNLERIARGGIRFDFARSTAPWTLPSHASMFTGRWPHELSVGWDRALDATYPTLAEYLAGQGYATAGFVGNVYYCNARYGLDRGFAQFEDYYENRTVSAAEVLRSASLGRSVLGLLTRSEGLDAACRKTAALLNHDLLAWLSRRPRQRPFFAFVNYYDAHAPCVLPAGAPRTFGHCKRPEPERIAALLRYQWMNEHGHPPAGQDEATVRREAVEILHDSYDSCIAYIDQELGRLFADLRERGLLENTLVIVTSDHGEHFKERGFLGHGQSVYRPEVDVPLVILPPARRQKPRVVSDAVSLRDLPSTVVDMLSVGASAPFPGRSLARFWSGDPPLARGEDPVLSEVEKKLNRPPMEAIPATLGAVKALAREGRIFIRSTTGREELYNVTDDPFERVNLVHSPEHIEALDRFRKTLDELLESPGDPAGGGRGPTAEESRP